MDIVVPEDSLMHYGVKGMKWGVRRYRNEDGSYTEEGKKRYRDVPKHFMRRKYIGTKEIEALPRKQRKALERWIRDNRDHYYLKGKGLYKEIGGRKAYDQMTRDLFSGKKIDNKIYEAVDVYVEVRGIRKQKVRDFLTYVASAGLVAAGMQFSNYMSRKRILERL